MIAYVCDETSSTHPCIAFLLRALSVIFVWVFGIVPEMFVSVGEFKKTVVDKSRFVATLFWEGLFLRPGRSFFAQKIKCIFFVAWIQHADD